MSPAANLLFKSAESPLPSTEHRRAEHPCRERSLDGEPLPSAKWPGAPTAVVTPLLRTLLPVLPSFGLTPASPSSFNRKTASSVSLSPLYWSLGCPVLVSVLPDWHNCQATFYIRTCLGVQWLRICLAMQGTQVWSLLWEDTTWCRATKQMHHKYWSPHALGPVLHKRSHCNKKPTNSN